MTILLLSLHKTTFVEKAAPYIGATKMNDIWSDIESIINALKSLPIDQGSYTATNSTSANYKMTSYRESAPETSELPLSFVIIPTITNAANLTITPSWGTTAYQVWDMTTNARVAAGVILANRPVQLMFDGTKMWVVSATPLVHGSNHLLNGSDPIPTDTTPTNGSSNLITSDAVYDVSARVTTVENALPNKADLIGGKVSAPQIAAGMVTYTASRTLVASDIGIDVFMNVATDNTFTLPANATLAIAVGSEFQLSQKGAGATTIVAEAGVTIRSLFNMTKLMGQYGGVHVKKVDTDEWYVWGALQ